MCNKDRLEIVLEALRKHIKKTQDAWRNEIENRCVNASIYGRDKEDLVSVLDDICSRTIGVLATEFPDVYCKSMDDSICHEIKLAIHL